jgi:hypothetical protein
MATRTLSQLEKAAQRAQDRHAAAQQRLDDARQAVIDRSWEHHAAVIGQLGNTAPSKPAAAPAPRAARAAVTVVARDPVAVAQERLAEALVEYERVARELGVT